MRCNATGTLATGSFKKDYNNPVFHARNDAPGSFKKKTGESRAPHDLSTPASESAPQKTFFPNGAAL